MAVINGVAKHKAVGSVARTTEKTQGTERWRNGETEKESDVFS